MNPVELMEHKFPDFERIGAYSYSAITDKIRQLAHEQDRHFPDLLCLNGCTDCCEDGILVTSQDIGPMQDGLAKLPRAIWRIIDFNLKERPDICPAQIRNNFGCALQKCKPIVCQSFGRLYFMDYWDLDRVSRRVFSCRKCLKYWKSKEKELKRESGGIVHLPPMGRVLFEVVRDSINRGPRITIRDVITEFKANQ